MSVFAGPGPDPAVMHVRLLDVLVRAGGDTAAAGAGEYCCALDEPTLAALAARAARLPNITI